MQCICADLFAGIRRAVRPDRGQSALRADSRRDAVLQPEVREFEPPAALFAGEDGHANRQAPGQEAAAGSGDRKVS